MLKMLTEEEFVKRTAGDGLEQEHRFVIRHTRQHRNGRLAVRQELAVDRGAPAVPGPARELLFAQDLQHLLHLLFLKPFLQAETPFD